MSTTEITRPEPVHEGLHDVPVLLVHLQDDLARSRLREAFWISLVFHLLTIISVVTAPKWFPERHAVLVSTPEQMIRDRQLTFLEMPPDRQKPTERPDTDKISDKNRIATSRQPTIDRKTLEELRDARRPGPPGAGGRPAPAMPPAAQAAPQNRTPDTAHNQGGAAVTQPSPGQQAARLEPPVGATAGGAFQGGGAMSPGSAIEQAARAAAASRGGYGGAGGDYGLDSGRPQSRIKNDLDVLSDTMGVDFGPYLARVLHDVRMNWYNIIPVAARAPLMKRGKVSIEFAILKDGQVRGMRLVQESGDVSLDRAAIGGISASNPFPPLPAEFRGQYLALRFYFFYNPDSNDLR